MYELYGVQTVDYLNRQGRQIRGTRLYCTFTDEKIEGYGTEAFFVSDRVPLPEDLRLGDKLKILYNRYGSIDSVEKLS